MSLRMWDIESEILFMVFLTQTNDASHTSVMPIVSFRLETSAQPKGESKSTAELQQRIF